MWKWTAHKGTARGWSGGNGGAVRVPVELVSSRGSELSGDLELMARGARILLQGTWSIVSVTSRPAEVSTTGLFWYFRGLSLVDFSLLDDEYFFFYIIPRQIKGRP